MRVTPHILFLCFGVLYSQAIRPAESCNAPAFMCSPVKVASAVARVHTGGPAVSHGLPHMPATSTGVHAGPEGSCP